MDSSATNITAKSAQANAQPTSRKGPGWKPVLQYLATQKWNVTQVFIALVLMSLIQMILPFLTQSIVDTSINTKNVSFLVVILVAQMTLIVSRAIVDFIRTRILFLISMVVNISLLTQFWNKLMRLPIAYFESKHAGDLLQRLEDNKVVQDFLTGTAMNTLFSLFTLVVYGIILLKYNTSLFFVFLGGTIVYVAWTSAFFQIRRKINQENFQLAAVQNGLTLQLIQGIKEIKLHNAEHAKQQSWKEVQRSIFKLGFKNLSISQIQQSGAVLINQSKDLIITFIVAKLVIDGQLTLGAMMAIQYIVGQLSAPVEQWITLAQTAQDARLSLDRLNEVHELADETPRDKKFQDQLPPDNTISVQQLSFRYPGDTDKETLKNIDVLFAGGKTTAIVGASGSGKTTLLKLLLHFYDDYAGELLVGDCGLKTIHPTVWRNNCSAVLQDGFVFDDTIARNIVVGDEAPDLQRLEQAADTANILEYINGLPDRFETRLGSQGVGLSQGQQQRLLIARAVYKNSPYLFLDEATSALDADNEKQLLEKMNLYTEGKTVVVIAHKLNTVKNADHIIVLEEGCVVEQGTHQQLADKKGKYFELVKNQLELSN